LRDFFKLINKHSKEADALLGKELADSINVMRMSCITSIPP
jgi:hypothetical protein